MGAPPASGEGGRALLAARPFRRRNPSASRIAGGGGLAEQLGVAGVAEVGFAKVGVAEVVEVTAIARRAYWYRATNRIAAARFDFLLCDSQTLQPVCAVDLDDTDDEFRERLCSTVGLPRVRLPADKASSYTAVHEAIMAAIEA